MRTRVVREGKAAPDPAGQGRLNHSGFSPESPGYKITNGRSSDLFLCTFPNTLILFSGLMRRFRILDSGFRIMNVQV